MGRSHGHNSCVDTSERFAPLVVFQLSCRSLKVFDENFRILASFSPVNLYVRGTENPLQFSRHGINPLFRQTGDVIEDDIELRTLTRKGCQPTGHK